MRLTTVTSIRRALPLTLLVLGVAALASDRPAAIGHFGLDVAGGDPAVRPGDDFYRYAAGTWQKATTLPPDRTEWGSFGRLREESDARVNEILEAAAAGDAPPGSIGRKIGDYYASFLDSAAIEGLGLGPAQAALEAIAAASSYDDIARLMARPDLELPAPINVAIDLDLKNPDRYVIWVMQGGLALPDRDFYLRDDGQFATLRDRYREHVAKLLALAGQPEPADSARTILALETAIARLQWSKPERRDRDKIYNSRSRAELVSTAPEFPWDVTLAAAGLGDVERVVVAEVSAMQPLAQLFRATSLDAWRRYLTYHFLRTHAAVLPVAFDREQFDFYGRTLSGQPEQRVRWKRAVAATNAALGEGIGQLYVERNFPPASKAAVLSLVENLRQAFGVRLRAVPWMTDATKQVAARKLATFRPKIGYPDRWRDYAALDVRRDDAFGNAVRASLFEWHREVERLGRPTDRGEWFMTPQTVNAYYNSVFNEVVFPAAILQPPFFDPAADPAVNYGAIGAVIGHEMGHGFDDQGSKSDAQGVLRSWWGERDVAAFKQLGDRLARQYDAYEPLPGIKVNGRLTLGENIGDLGGVTVALEAYHLSLHGRPAPVLDGLSGDQRFFLGYAQTRRSLIREEELRNRVLSDPHSPSVFRVNGVVRNIDAWYAAFGVRPGDKLYLKPAERVHIW